jgi:hypothetical protein
MRSIARFAKRGVWLVAFLFAAVVCQAQEFRATLTGVVTDPSGALIPGTVITATNVESGTKFTGKTSTKGVYYINYVLPGVYTITAEAKGFKTDVQEQVTLFTAQTFNQNFQLSVGNAGDTVTVSDAPPMLETSTGSGGTVLGARELENVPLNGGQAYSLIGTTPGSQVTSQAGPNGNSGSRGWDVSSSYSLGGGVNGTNQFTLNGANITSQFSYDNHSAGEWTVSPNIDSVQEVNVMTQTYDARFGRTSGGTINVDTKSGGNQFHGTAHYAYEDGGLFGANINQFIINDIPRQQQVQNQFWITAGGPIIKNKLFFFFGFEGYRQSIAGGKLENVAPAYLRPGFNGNAGVDFSLIQTYDSTEFPNGLPIYQPGTATCKSGGPVTSCNTNNIAQTQFAGNAIPANMISPISTALLKYIPLPNIAANANLAKGYNYIANTPDLYDYNQPQIRVDYNLTDKTKLYSYFLYWKGSEYRSNNGLSGPAANGNINWIHQNYVATQDITHTFSPSLTADFKIAFDRFYESSPNSNYAEQPSPTSIGLAMPLPATTSRSIVPQFNVGDDWGTGLISNNAFFGNNINNDVTNNFAFNVDFTKTHGRHTMEIGGEIDEFQFGGFPSGGGNPNGTFGFGSGFTQYNPQNEHCYKDTTGQCTATDNQNGSALASFYLGLPTGGSVDWIGSIMEGYPVYAAYFQDNWRVTPKLTMNMGFRYDVQRGLRERHNNLNRGLCLTCVNPLTNDATYQANVKNTANLATWSAAGIATSSLSQVLGGLQFAGTDGQSRDAYDTDWSNAGPRFGIAYQINAKTVIRGGYGIMYSYGLEGGSSIGDSQPTNYTTSTDGGNTPTTGFQSGNPYASGLLKPTGNSLGLLTDVGNGTIQADFPNRKIPIEQVMSLGFQRELPGATVLDVSYAGNLTNRLRVNLWRNGVATKAMEDRAIADPSYYDQQVPNPYYGVAGMSGPGQCGTVQTIKAIALLLPGSQYCSANGNGPGLIGQYNAPLGGNFYHALLVKLSKRVVGGSARGFSYQIAYTWSKSMDADGYRNGWPYQDIERYHQLNGSDRTHVLAVTSVYDLPFGHGRTFLSNSNGLVDRLIGGWTLSGVFTAQSGTPVSINTGFYYNCQGGSYASPKGSTLGHWINQDQSCYTSVPDYGYGVLVQNIDSVRTPTQPNLDASLQKTTRIFGRLGFDLRLDAFNATNSRLLGGPDTNPNDGPATYSPNGGWSGFGTVGPNQANFARILQIGGKLSF